MDNYQLPALSGIGHSAPASLPVAIDCQAVLALRQMVLATLWNTGARINEALALTRSDFSLALPYPFVQLATLKQRAEKAARTAGRAPAPPPGSAFRSPLRQPASDDGSHAENSAGAAQ